MLALFSFEWKIFWRNIKNIVTLLIFLFLCIYLALAVEADYRPLRKIDSVEIAALNRDAKYFIETRDDSLYSRTIPMFEGIAETTDDLLGALEAEDYVSVMNLENDLYTQNMVRFEGQDPNYYLYNVPEFERTKMAAYDNIALSNHYDLLEEGNFKLSLNLIEGRTALQALTRQFKGLLPLGLIILVIVYGIDIFAEDKKHQTLVGEMPITKNRRLLVKSLVVMTALMLTFLIGSVLFVGLMSIQTGLGGLDLPVPHIIHSISIGKYLLQVCILLLLIAWMFVRGMTLVSLYINHASVNLLFIPLIFVGNLWHRSGIAYARNEFSFYPPTYFRMGDVVSNYLNFWYDSEYITFWTGVIVLLAVIALVELLLQLSVRFQSKALYS